MYRKAAAIGAGAAFIVSLSLAPAQAAVGRPAEVVAPVCEVVAHADCQGADLTGADLSGLELQGINLAGANLAGANLSGATLSQADLGQADLAKATLTDAILTDADLGAAAELLAIDDDVSSANAVVEASSARSLSSPTCGRRCQSLRPGSGLRAYYFYSIDRHVVSHAVRVAMTSRALV